MDNPSKEYILQWSGHAASITERFSGLLARQALVDVTLICQEQKLRVHKLVLASCSLYFEEMLEQDLGQEPIILLRDLDFDILKAMVEFMYCGETTISHCHLQALLDAAQVFKVEDLESILYEMMSSTNYSENNRESMNNDNYAYTNSLNIGRNCIQVKLCGKDCSEKSSQFTNDLFDNGVTLKSDNNIDNEPNVLNDDIEINDDSEISEIIDSINEFPIGELNSIKLANNHTVETTIDDSRIIYDDYCDNHKISNCKITESSTLLSKKINEKCDTNDCSDLFDVRDGIGECLRVYTSKKRKSIEEQKKSVIGNRILLPEQFTTDCIDLSDDTTCDIAPVTLTTNLDMVTNDYIWSFNADSIRYVIESCTMNPVNPIFSDRNRSIYDDKKNIRQIKELFSVDNENITLKRPILRRSERLNQPDIDDNIHNNYETISKEKSRFNNTKCMAKSRRNIKESDENSVQSKRNINNSRTIRSTTKFASKSSGSGNTSARCTYAKISKGEKIKSSASKLKGVNHKLINKIDTIENDTCIPIKLNTIASVSRALWGDMSDIMENSESGVSLPEYSLSKEIPFAVGLLPLHAALERMQAIPDYQPRKTRSSSAPIRHHHYQQQQQDQSINGLKRKIILNDNDTICTAKKLNNSNCVINNNNVNADSNGNNDDGSNDNSRTFCHIEIHTSSRCSESHNSPGQILSIESTSDDKR